MWQRGDWKTSARCCPSTPAKGHGEGFMHDTAMLLGALGWSAYDAPVEVVTPYFGASRHRADQRAVPGHAAGRPRRAGAGAWRRQAQGYQPSAVFEAGPAMPHLVILYTGNLDAETDMPALCRTLCRHDADGARRSRRAQVFPTGGTRVLAYPAAHWAVADGARRDPPAAVATSVSCT
jgi:hypothetical protein